MNDPIGAILGFVNTVLIASVVIDYFLRTRRLVSQNRTLRRRVISVQKLEELLEAHPKLMELVNLEAQNKQGVDNLVYHLMQIENRVRYFQRTVEGDSQRAYKLLKRVEILESKLSKIQIPE